MKNKKATRVSAMVSFLNDYDVVLKHNIQFTVSPGTCEEAMRQMALEIFEEDRPDSKVVACVVYPEFI